MRLRSKPRSNHLQTTWYKVSMSRRHGYIRCFTHYSITVMSLWCHSWYSKYEREYMFTIGNPFTCRNVFAPGLLMRISTRTMANRNSWTAAPAEYRKWPTNPNCDKYGITSTKRVQQLFVAVLTVHVGLHWTITDWFLADVAYMTSSCYLHLWRGLTTRTRLPSTPTWWPLSRRSDRRWRQHPRQRTYRAGASRRTRTSYENNQCIGSVYNPSQWMCSCMRSHSIFTLFINKLAINNAHVIVQHITCSLASFHNMYVLSLNRSVTCLMSQYESQISTLSRTWSVCVQWRRVQQRWRMLLEQPRPATMPDWRGCSHASSCDWSLRAARDPDIPRNLRANRSSMITMLTRHSTSQLIHYKCSKQKRKWYSRKWWINSVICCDCVNQTNLVYFEWDLCHHFVRMLTSPAAEVSHSSSLTLKNQPSCSE